MEDVFHKHSFSIDHRIFFDLSLSTSSYFQIDTLILTPSFTIVFEVKNIAGSLKFIETPPQLIRTSADGQVDGFDSPVAQVERNVELLEEWIHTRGIHLPVYGVVVLAYPKQIVELAPVKTKVLFPKLIPSYIKNLYDNPSKLKKDSFNWLCTKLMKGHRNFIPPLICETYHIPRSDIRTGVECKLCGKLGMKRVFRNWSCSNCGNNDKLAHQKAIKEWFLLFGGKMTNKNCREFLQIDDMKTATRLLQSMNLRSEGSFRNRSYYMDFK